MQKQTTVTIDQKTFATLDRLAKSNDVSKKEFLSCALEYFEKYGINPVQHESPAKEMQKLIKRCARLAQRSAPPKPVSRGCSTSWQPPDRCGTCRKPFPTSSNGRTTMRGTCAATYSSFWAEPPSRNGKRSCILASSLTQRRKAVFSTTLRHCTRSRDKSL